MSELIHNTAIISKGAVIGENVSIGPFCVIGPNIEIKDNCKIHSHVVMDGHMIIGENNEFFPFCSIGAAPQDLTYKNEPTRVEIGNNNVFREYVSIHRGTLKEDKITRVGNDNLLMAHVHLGHDVALGSHCVFANSVNIAGHVKIGDRVIIGGGTSISQFITLGRGAYIGGASAIDRDVPLFCTAFGNRIRLKGINIIGLRRQGYSKPVISEFVDFFRSMEASALSPRAFINHDELMSEYLENELVLEMGEEIKNSEVGPAPFMVS